MILKNLCLAFTLAVFMLVVNVVKARGENKTCVNASIKTYRVQVCALHNKIKEIRLLAKDCRQANLIEEETEGYFKYLTQDVPIYRDALKMLHEIRTIRGFEGSFLVMYQGGKRTKSLFNAEKIPFEEKQNIKPTAVVIYEKPESGDSVLKSIKDLTTKKAKPFGTIHVTINRSSNRLIATNWVIYVLYVFSTGFLLLAVFLLIHCFKTIRKRKKLIALKELYAEKLAAYLSDDSDDLPVPEMFEKANTGFQKDILIGEIISMLNTLSDEKHDKIRDLYFKLHLDFYSFRKLQNKQWTIKAMAIHELATLDAVHEADSIEELINHPNPVLRHEAITAIIRLRPSDPFGFLDKLRMPFTKLDQLMAAAVLQKHHLKVPDFSRWFDSYDPSVVVFAVEMVVHYKQTEASEYFDKLLRHSYEEVRESVIIAIGEMHLTGHSTRLITLFNEEHERIQLLILRTMGTLQDASLLNFLSDLVLLNPFMNIRMEAARALVAIGPQGLTRLQTLLLNENSDISYIYHQIVG